ncbi:LytR/AlgR family response regulator transcription factor [Alteromonas sediminis]|uniref:LytR/AlgR family response regulator transcription factor n=1 Tax=Alteromonas sediminis TaxID=2259342 RepID=UPI00366D2372
MNHAAFWLSYYVLFSLIWATPEQGYFASFYLEFILMPVRIFAVYCMLYWLIPNFLAQRQYKIFVLNYAVVIAMSGLLQMFFSYFFYNQLMPELSAQTMLSLSGWFRSCMLINTTVILLGSLKILQMNMQLQEELARIKNKSASTSEYIEVKSNRKMYRLKINDILFLQGMGNYVTYHLEGRQKHIVYMSLKQALDSLPKTFIRVHRSYVVNKRKIDSYNQDEIFIGEQTIPRGKDTSDEDLRIVD